MASESISAHVVVLSQTGAKLADAKAGKAAETDNGENFAHLLTAQIQGNAAADVGGSAVIADSKQSDGGDKGKQDPDIQALISNDPASSQADATNLAALQIVLPQTASVTIDVRVSTCCAEDGPANAALAAAGARQTHPAIDLNADGKAAATDALAPAKFAAVDKILPSSGGVIEAEIREHISEAVDANPQLSNLAAANRAAPQAAANVPSNLPAVQVPVGQAGWDEAFSQRVLWAAGNAQQVAHLELNPPHLGPLEIRISLTSDQANAAFTSPHAAVRDAIEAALPRLRDMLADNGLSLGNVNVSSQSFQQQQPQQQSFGQSGGQRHDPFQELQALASGHRSGAAVQSGVATIRLPGNGAVDIFA